MSAIDPEQARQAREAALRAAQSAQSEGGASPAPPQPWKLSVDLGQTSRQARGMGSIDRAVHSEGEGAWRSRAQLIETGEDGAPLKSPPARPVDMKASDGYGEKSKHALDTINKFFVKQDCSELHFDAPDKIFAKVAGQRVQVDCAFSSEEEYNRFIEDLVEQADTVKTVSDFKKVGRGVVRLAAGDRMAMLFPPLTDYASASIHKVVARGWKLEDVVRKGTLTPEMANFLVAAVQAKANILVCGELGAGKSTMLSLLAQAIGDNERIALIEEVGEIFLDKPDVVRITYYPDSPDEYAKGLPEVYDTALYMRFDRIIVGEIHERGMYHMIRSMSSGSDGTMSTFHAGNVGQALDQVRNHIILEHKIDHRVATDYVRKALDLVLILERVDGVHRVVEMAEINYRDIGGSDNVISRAQLWEWDRDQKRHVCKDRIDEQSRISQKSKKHGVVIRPEWFDAEHYRRSEI